MATKRVHFWGRIAYMGKVRSKCNRLISVKDFTPDADKVTCLACLKLMEKK